MKKQPARKPIISDDTILLRTYSKRDARSLYEAVVESRPELWPWLPFAHENYAIWESEMWIQRHPKDWKQGVAYNFGIFDAANGSYLGGCGLNDVDIPNRRANLGYWVRTTKSRHGVAPAAALLLADWGFREIGLKRIEILVAAENHKSLRVAEKVGAVREGLLHNRLILDGVSHDAVIFSLTRADNP